MIGICFHMGWSVSCYPSYLSSPSKVSSENLGCFYQNPALWWALNFKFLFLNPISLKHCLTSQTLTGCLQISKCFEGKKRAKCQAYLFGLPFSEDLGSSYACFLDGSPVFSNRFFNSYFIQPSQFLAVKLVLYTLVCHHWDQRLTCFLNFNFSCTYFIFTTSW